MTWFQVDTGRSRNRKTYRLAELLGGASGDLFGGLPREAWRAMAIALLDELWGYVAEHHPSGDVTDASADAVRDVLLPWIIGTAWVRAEDVRELLVKSGHIDRLPDGRMVVHDWLEWSGTALVKLAKDRKRKRLARAGSALKKSWTRPKDTSKQKRRTRPVVVRAREDQRREDEMRVLPDQQQPPAAHAVALDYATRCCLAANQALEQLLAGAYRPLVAAVQRETSVAWEAAGVPVELAVRIVEERTAAFRATPHNRQPNTLRYFDAAVREAWAGEQAREAGPALSPGDRARRRAAELEAEELARGVAR